MSHTVNLYNLFFIGQGQPMILGYPLSIIIRYNFIFPLDTASAIIKALYALTILPDLEIF
ncbi:MAG TPA: hypothetical protein DIT95_07570 [Arenibacter sp.]|nr:hypothetical protein [Arenibacter sp.]